MTSPGSNSEPDRDLRAIAHRHAHQCASDVSELILRRGHSVACQVSGSAPAPEIGFRVVTIIVPDDGASPVPPSVPIASSPLKPSRKKLKDLILSKCSETEPRTVQRLARLCGKTPPSSHFRAQVTELKNEGKIRSENGGYVRVGGAS